MANWAYENGARKVAVLYLNSDWGINLGANDSAEPSTVTTDLVANGKNLGVAGNTVKLYPTRKTSEKIFCTVE